MDLVNPSDAAYLLAEGQGRPMNIGMLLIYDLPHDAKPDYVARLHERIVANETAAPSFRKHPVAPLAGVGSLAWGLDDELDLGFHVRRVAQHAPGTIGALFETVSELHASILDRHRPLWEAYLIEGLPDARFAVYLKVPGPRDRMFWNGARLAAVYPMSFLSDGLALSLSYAATSEDLGVGVLACRRAAPYAEDLLTHMDKALNELEAFYR